MIAGVAPDPETGATSTEGLVAIALEHPYRYAPLRQAVTSDDQIAIVVDDSFPGMTEVLSSVLKTLKDAGIELKNVTAILRSEAPEPKWIDELPEAYTDIQTEIHNPDDPKKLAYVATTSGERRVYLNRRLVESDFVIVVGGRRFDALSGIAGGEDLIFPALSNEETRLHYRGIFRYKNPVTDPEIREIIELFGSPFFVQAIDAGSRIVEIVAGLPNSLLEGISRYKHRWCSNVSDRPRTVIASISQTADFAELALAAINAARVVEPGGRIVLLSPELEISGTGIDILKRYDDPRLARRMLKKVKPDDWVACHLWATAARRARIYLANCESDLAEELFAFGIGNARELERLIESSEAVLVLHQAHRSVVRMVNHDQS